MSDDPVYTYKTIRTPKHIINQWKIRYPGHDIYYRVRKNLATGVSQYQPYCQCHGWKNDKWYPHRGHRMERLFVYEHINEIDKQGQLTFGGGPGKGEEAHDSYGPTHFDNLDRLHDHTL